MMALMTDNFGLVSITNEPVACVLTRIGVVMELNERPPERGLMPRQARGHWLLYVDMASSSARP